MAASKRGVRKGAGQQNDSAGTIEAAAFGTTAGAMLLGVLAGAAGSQRAADTDGAHNSQPARPADTDGEAMRGQDLPRPDSQHSGPLSEPDIHHAAAAVQPEATIKSPTPVVDESHAAAGAPAGGASAASDHADGAGIHAPAPPAAFEAAAPAGPVLPMEHDAPASADMSAGMQDMMAATFDTLGQMTQSVTELSATVLQRVIAIPAATAGAVVTAVFGAPPGADAPAGGFMPDASALVPVLFDPGPLHIGFAGQAQPDGHDAHDGAFSALGVTHF